jgi:hypothetical protein
MVKHYFWTLRHKTSPRFELEVEESLTVADVHPLVAAHWGFVPDTIRFLQGTRTLDKTLAVTSITSAPDKVIVVFGTAPAPPAAPPQAVQSAAPVVVGPDDKALAQLADMGYDVGAARAALTLARGRLEVAAELLLTGDVSEAGLRAISGAPPGESRPSEPRRDIQTLPRAMWAELLPMIVRRQEHLVQLQMGQPIELNTPTGVAVTISPEFVDHFLRETTGKGLAETTIIPDGSVYHM